MESKLNVKVNLFKSYIDTNPIREINLLEWLQSEQYAKEVEKIRSLENKEERDKLKAKLPAITPSGLFASYRAADKFMQHSGLIQFDIDSKENPLITDWQAKKTELSKIVNIAYCGLSVSGRGLWGLIPIPKCDPDRHKKHFEALFSDFQALGIAIDRAPQNVVSLRGYSYDKKAYFNHNAETYIKLPVKKRIPIKRDRPHQLKNIAEYLVNRIKNSVPNANHSERLKIGMLAGGYIAAGLLDNSIENQLINTYMANFANDSEKVQYKEIKALHDGIEKGKLNPICKH